MWDAFIISQRNTFSDNVPPACFKPRMRSHWELTFQNRLFRKPIKVFSCLASFTSDLFVPCLTTEKKTCHQQIKGCSLSRANPSLPSFFYLTGKDLDCRGIQSNSGSSLDKWSMVPEYWRIKWMPQQCCKYMLSSLPSAWAQPIASSLPRNMCWNQGTGCLSSQHQWTCLASSGFWHTNNSVGGKREQRCHLRLLLYCCLKQRQRHRLSAPHYIANVSTGSCVVLTYNHFVFF